MCAIAMLRTDQGIAVTKYSYTPDGEVETVTDPRGAGYVTTYGYDGMDRVYSIMDAEGEITRHLYDGVGNLIADIDPRGGGAPGTPSTGRLMSMMQSTGS